MGRIIKKSLLKLFFIQLEKKERAENGNTYLYDFSSCRGDFRPNRCFFYRIYSSRDAKEKKKEILREAFLALVETDLKIWEDSIENYELNTDLFFLMENHLWYDNELDTASLLPKAYPYLARYFRLCEGINKKKFHVNEKFSQETCNYFIELLESARDELNHF